MFSPWAIAAGYDHRQRYLRSVQLPNISLVLLVTTMELIILVKIPDWEEYNQTSMVST